jgi:hypothetical protein
VADAPPWPPEPPGVAAALGTGAGASPVGTATGTVGTSTGPSVGIVAVEGATGVAVGLPESHALNISATSIAATVKVLKCNLFFIRALLS